MDVNWTYGKHFEIIYISQTSILYTLIKCYMSIICNKTRENIKTRRIKWSSNLTSGYISKGRKLGSQRDIYPRMFTAVYYKIDEREEGGSVCVCVCVCVCVTQGHTKEHYLAIKNKEILSFLKIWMELEDIMLSEINQRKANTIWYHLQWSLQKPVKETLREYDNGY